MLKWRPWKRLLLGLGFLVAVNGHAVSPVLTYQGRIFDPQNQPLKAGAVTFYVSITGPAPACSLYSENFTTGIPNGDGVFSLVIGRNGSVNDKLVSPPSFERIFNSHLVLPSNSNCPGGKSATDPLHLLVSFDDGTGIQTLPPLEITPSPVSFDTISVAGTSSKSVLRVEGRDAPPLDANGFDSLMALINGTSTTYLKSVSTPSISTGSLSARGAAGVSGRLFICTDDNLIYRDDGSQWVALGGGGSADAIDLSVPINGVLGVSNGGTNSSATLQNNRIMVSSGGAIVETGAITANRVLVSNASGLPTASSVTSSVLGYLSDVTGPIQNQIDAKVSGSGWTSNSVMAVNNSGVMQAVPSGAANTILQSSLTGPVWSSVRYPSSTTANQLIFSSSDNILAGLNTANNALLMTDPAGVPAWSPLSNDHFAQYAYLNGRSGGQTLIGGVNSGENLVLKSTSHATKGNILIGSDGDKVGMGTTSPQAALDVNGEIRAGNSGLSCAAITKGAVRYNDGTNCMEFCNGSVWMTMCGVGVAAPAPFGFVDQTGVAPLATTTSNTVTLSGFGGTATATCGPNCIGISRNGGPFVPGPVADFISGDTIAIQLKSANGPLAVEQATVSVGATTSAIWTVTTGLKAVYTYTGSDQEFTVPAGYSSFTVKMWGAGGGGGNHTGGAGGYVSGKISAPAGTTFKVIVGGGGSQSGLVHEAYGGGSTATWGWGGGGGGRSAISFSGTDIMTAGAGGGGSGGICCTRYAGGGGGLSGAGGGSYQGWGGTQTAGGAANTSAGGSGAFAGTQYKGGNSGNGAGGGGGYFGGGATTDGNAGGGGGSSYYGGGAGFTVTLGATSTGASAADGAATVNPPFTTDSDYQTGVGIGGRNAAGGPGLVIITCP